MRGSSKMKQTILILLFRCVSWSQAAASSPLGSLSLYKRYRYRRPSPSCRRDGSCFLANTFYCTRSNNNHRIYPRLILATKIVPSIHKRWENTGSNYVLAVSRSKSKSIDEMTKRNNQADNSGTRTKKKRSNGVVDCSANKGRRMKKTEIDDLVRGIGLEPVVQTITSKKKSKATFNSTPNPQSQLLMNDAGRNQQQKSTADPLSIMQQQSLPPISLQTQLDYTRNGHAVLHSFLPQTLIEQLRSELIPYAASHALSAWHQKVEVQLADSSDQYYRDNARTIANNLKSIEECHDLLESLGMDPMSGDLPFLQYFNTWRAPPAPDANDNNSDKANTSTPTVRRLCLSPYLARTASILLNAPTIRLYQDSLFHKRAGDGWTPWHSDARMAPFDTSKMITFWIPLQKVPVPEEGGTGLRFVDGSHSDFALPYWNGVVDNEYDRLERRYGDGDGGVSHHMPLELGDVTVHNGWTLHCADAADCIEDAEDRYAFSITFVDGRAEVREDVIPSQTQDDARKNSAKIDESTTPKGDKEDVWSFRSWVEGVKPRMEFRHPSVPIVWPTEEINAD